MQSIKISFTSTLLFLSLVGIGQPNLYSTINAHSHNDYENPIPFHTAYDNTFGSIEADIFLF